MNPTMNEGLMEDFLHVGHMLRRKKQHFCKPQHDHPHEYGGNPPWQRERVLRTVGGFPEGIAQNRVAAELGIRPQSLSELLSKLESEELILRRKNPEDMRETLVYLTEKGRTRQEAAEEESRRQADELMSALTEEECKELRRLLDKILSVVDGENWRKEGE